MGEWNNAFSPFDDRFLHGYRSMYPVKLMIESSKMLVSRRRTVKMRLTAGIAYSVAAFISPPQRRDCSTAVLA